MGFKTLSQKRKEFLMNVLAMTVIVALIFIIFLEINALSSENYKGSLEPTGNILFTEEAGETPTEEPTPTPTEEPYFIINESGSTIEERFNPPKGYERVETEKGSFGEFLRTYPLKDYGEKALLFSGAYNDDAATLGVLRQTYEISQNQQCADTAIMLYGEYLYTNGRFSEIVFNFSSGFKCDFLSWAEGKRPVVNGRNVTWTDKTGTDGVKANDYSAENFVAYLKKVYEYANTDSLVMQYSKKSFDSLAPGDIFVATASELRKQAESISEDAVNSVSYGHAVIVADVAVNEAGEKVFLLIEGTTPATECAVVEAPDEDMVCWFRLSSDGTFVKNKKTGIKWKNTWLYSFEN